MRPQKNSRKGQRARPRGGSVPGARRSVSDDHGAAEAPAAPTALLDAALRVFSEKGYRATRLEAVAAAADVTKGAIYYYFNGKEDLLEQAVRSRHEAIFDEVARALEGEGDGVPAATRIRFVLRKVWRHWLDPATGAAIRLMVGEVSVELPALFRTWAEVGPVRGWTVVRDLIDEGKRSGEFRPDVDGEVAARLVVSGLMLQALLHVHLGLGSLAPCDADRLLDSSIDVFLRGVSAAAPAART